MADGEKMTKEQKSHKRALMHFVHLLTAAVGIYVAYITYGVIQEWMYHYTSPSGRSGTPAAVL
jgi:hypothetical protein